jgi:hypothetical protein
VSKVAQLIFGQLNGADSIRVELVEADETPAVVIVTWPAKPTVCHPRRFPDVAAMVARLFASASTAVSRINARKRL